MDRLVVSTWLSLNSTNLAMVCVVVERAHTDTATKPVDNSKHSSGLWDLQVMYGLWDKRRDSRAAVQ